MKKMGKMYPLQMVKKSFNQFLTSGDAFPALSMFVRQTKVQLKLPSLAVQQNCSIASCCCIFAAACPTNFAIRTTLQWWKLCTLYSLRLLIRLSDINEMHQFAPLTEYLTVCDVLHRFHEKENRLVW